MNRSVKLVKLPVVANATQKNVQGEKNAVAVKKRADEGVLEATTSPKNNLAEWKPIGWSRDKGEPVPAKPNRRKLSLAVSRKYH